MTTAAILIFDKCLYLRGRLRLTTARWLSAYMSSRALATTAGSSLFVWNLTFCYSREHGKSYPYKSFRIDVVKFARWQHHAILLGRGLPPPLFTPPRLAELCDRSLHMSFCLLFCRSVRRITRERVNGRRPNLVDIGKGWPSKSG